MMDRATRSSASAAVRFAAAVDKGNGNLADLAVAGALAGPTSALDEAPRLQRRACAKRHPVKCVSPHFSIATALLRPKFRATSRARVECQVLGLFKSRLAHTAMRHVCSAFNRDRGLSAPPQRLAHW